MAQNKAVKIEERVSATFSTSAQQDAYREKIRSLFLNLRDPTNPGLRLRVLTGQLEVKTFCVMTAQEMKSKERIEEEESIKAENLFKVGWSATVVVEA